MSRGRLGSKVRSRAGFNGTSIAEKRGLSPVFARAEARAAVSGVSVSWFSEKFLHSRSIKVELMLEQLLNELERVFPEYERQGMHPGALDAEIDAAEESLKPFRFPSELRELYGWHNGSSTAFFPELPLFGFQFNSLEDGMDDIVRLGGGPYGEPWEKHFLPIGDTSCGLMLATLNNLNNERSQIYEYFIEGGDAYLMHQGVSSMIETAMFIWSNTPGEGRSLDDVRLRFSPGAYIGTQKGLTNASGVRNVFDFSCSLPDCLI